MNSIEKEYDGFGPWLIKIKNQEDVPQQFLSRKDQIMEGIMAFKIPVDLEHREVKAGMLLYDTVVVITDTQFKTFHYMDGIIGIKEIELRDILFIQHVVDLLSGELAIGTAKEIVTINFNAVSKELVEEAVALLRRKYVSGRIKIDLESIDEKVEIKSYLFQFLVKRNMAAEKIKLIEYLPVIVIEKGSITNTKQLKDIYHEPVLQDILFLTNGCELIILNRMREIKDEKETDYGYKQTYIPLEYIRKIFIDQDSNLSNISDMKFEIADTELSVKVSNEFSSQLENIKRTLQIS